MKENCDCHYCKEKVNEYFCLTCGYNFNGCESKFTWRDITLCPKCHPEKKVLCGREMVEK